MGAINRECCKKLILGVLELGRAIYEITSRKAPRWVKNVCLLLAHGESPFKHFLLHCILTFLDYGEENNR
jgi:hypothetical protein